MRVFFLNRTLALVACFGLATVGCAPPTTEVGGNNNAPPVATEELEHMHMDNHAHASTFPEAVAQIDKLNAEISAAFAEGKGQDADSKVHEIGHALEDVTGLAKKSNLSEEDQTSVGVAVESLLDAFGKVDEKLHGHDGADYADVSSEINTAMETLKKFAGEAK